MTEAQQKERYGIYTNSTGKTQQINNPIFITKHIGSTTYRVQIHMAQEGVGTLEEKLLRMVTNELENSPTCGMMDQPQMSRQSEGSA